MGLSLYGLSLKGNMLQLSWMTAMKLLVQPLVTWGIVLVMGLDPFWAASAVLLAALPAGSMVYVLAQQYERRVELASSTILSTTVLSLVTLALLLPLIKSWVG
jgi:predicted permease